MQCTLNTCRLRLAAPRSHLSIRPVPRATGNGGIDGRRSGLEHHLQSWPFDGHRRQRDFQYKARQREMRRE